jgi:hypothetical protein
MSEKKSTGEKRSSNWNFILYPESAPANWRELIDETHIEWVESPLHDKDVNEENSEIKKAHYHITLLFPSLKSFEQVKELTDSVNAPIPVKCQSVKGSIRYMAHKDNPEKFQYNWGDIKCHGGVDLSSLCAPTATERLEIQSEIIKYIRENGIMEFYDIVNYAEDNGLADWKNVLLNYSTMAINAYIKSQRHKFEKIEQRSGEK